METNKVILQRLKKSFPTEIEKAEMYFGIISSVNALGLSTREIQLVAFTAVKGNISNGNAREEFCRIYDTSIPTINNIISKLKRLSIFVKENKKIKVNQKLALDFKKEIVLQFNME